MFVFIMPVQAVVAKLNIEGQHRGAVTAARTLQEAEAHSHEHKHDKEHKV